MAQIKSTYTIENFTFTYPGKREAALKKVNLEVLPGELMVICGQSGSGKSTLLRNLKPILAPFGEKSGKILFNGIDVNEMSQEEQAAKIGYVLQNPDAQIVTEKVWHELAFGLESLGLDTKTIRLRVAEMASFFGIQTWFHKNVNELSGGQKQLLNLAAVMAMQPEVLILDEPTSQLDPIAAGDFLETVSKINRELGTTVIIIEHRLEEVLTMADRAVVLDQGEIIADDLPPIVGKQLAEQEHPMFLGMPTPVQAYAMLYKEGIGQGMDCPVNIREGRQWLTSLLKGKEIRYPALPAVEEQIPLDKTTGKPADPAIEMKDVWFRYNKNDPDVIKDLSLKVYPQEMLCIVGGNGTGKTTSVTLMAGINKPYRGKVRVNGKKTVVLPQNPQSIFVENTLALDLAEMLESEGKNSQKKELLDQQIQEIAQLVEISDLLQMHPYDLSGGEQQRAALAKVLLSQPDILILDEPTKGIDNGFKAKLAGILKKLQDRGVTIVIVSHDVEFCGRYADRCAMFFDGKIITTNTPRTFFSGNSFYTTASNRMSRHLFENAVNVDDLVELVKRNLQEKEPTEPDPLDEPNPLDEPDGQDQPKGGDEPKHPEQIQEAPFAKGEPVKKPKESLTKKNLLVELGAFAAAVLTIYLGFFAFDNKHYMAVCILMIFYALVPFFVQFEQSRPQARELMILAVMIATAVVGRAAFYAIPNFKPILAIVIISGVAMGRRSGFLVGAMSAFVSNFLFGQGPWTPWQLIAMALAGYLAGAIFSRYYNGTDGRRIWPLVIFGAVTVFFLYGGIVDIWTILVATPTPTIATAVTVYGAAVYFNLVHAIATAFFLFVLAKPMLGKLNRVKRKYGITFAA